MAGLDERQIEDISKTIFRFCLSKTGSFHDSEDLAQEILLIAFRSTNRFDSEKAFYAFVWKTAGHIMKSWYRRRSGPPTVEPDEELPDNRSIELEEQARDREQLRLILRELARLSSDYRRLMVKYYIDGSSVREIARHLSLSESMVKYLLFQSRKRIREGIRMEMESCRLSYDPVELSLFFWGGRCRYYDVFLDNRLRQNIAMACYYDKLTEEQLSLHLGVPTAYLEDDLKKLVDYDLLMKKGMSYRSNIVIITRKETEAINRHNAADLRDIASAIRAFVDGNMDSLRALGFYGSDMPLNSLKWMIISLILRAAYLDIMRGDVALEYPTDRFGDSCFRFLIETRQDDPYLVGISRQSTEDGSISMWDVQINGEAVHPKMGTVQTNALLSLFDAQPVTNGEKLACAELLELGLAKKEGTLILPKFPCLNAEQNAALSNAMMPVSRSICDNAKSRIDRIAGIMLEYAPDHLKDYARRLPALFLIKEAEIIMQILCESGWLLPLKDGMLATTVMVKTGQSGMSETINRAQSQTST